MVLAISSALPYSLPFLRRYKNLDKLINHVNADGRVRAFYSTPDAVSEAVGPKDAHVRL